MELFFSNVSMKLNTKAQWDENEGIESSYIYPLKRIFE